MNKQTYYWIGRAFTHYWFVCPNCQTAVKIHKRLYSLPTDYEHVLCPACDHYVEPPHPFVEQTSTRNWWRKL